MKKSNLDFDFKPPYDFALSFAGCDEDAKYIRDRLTDNKISVFYCNNGQSRIPSESVEAYLAPIYRSESVYVIPLLSNEYPISIWCGLRGETFQARFGADTVIPLRYSDCKIEMFDASNGIGDFILDKEKPIQEQLDQFVALLISKINKKRCEERDSNSA